jgi:hypothetical protein
MEISDIKKERIRTVQIHYDVSTNEWYRIQVDFANDMRVDVNREQIEAFLRMQKVLEDLHQIEHLRDDLKRIFGEMPQKQKQE